MWKELSVLLCREGALTSDSIRVSYNDTRPKNDHVMIWKDTHSTFRFQGLSDNQQRSGSAGRAHICGSHGCKSFLLEPDVQLI